MDMGTCSERDITTCQPGHFGQTEPPHQEKGVIASAEPGTLIRRGEQRLDFCTRKKMNLCAREALAGDSQYALDLIGMSRRFERSIPKEGVDGGQP